MLTAICCAHAQDANYWNSSYCAGGFTTPGAVIAYNKDSGMLFYNPALLAWSHKSTATINATLYQFESINLKNGVGTGYSLHSKGASVIPQMISGVVSFKHAGFAYALLREPSMSFQATQRKDVQQNVLNDSYSPGTEYYIGQVALQNSTVNTTALMAAGFEITPSLSAGFSLAAQLRKQTYDLDITSRALVNAPDSIYPPISSSEESYLLSYLNVGLQLKGGLAYNNGRHHLGLTVGLPQVQIGGRGTLLSDFEVNNIRDELDINFNLLANTRQTSLHNKYKTPLSIGLGYAFDYSSSGQIYLAAEYFARVKEYNVVTPRNDTYIRPDTGGFDETTSALLKFKDIHRAVFNLAAGISFNFTPAVQGYCSFRTDFTYADDKHFKDENGMVANLSNWSQYHLQLGANFRKRKFNLRPGLLFTYGSTHNFMQPINFDNPNEQNFLQGDPHTVKATRFATGLMLSYVHNL
ncbi:hypothetical protein DXN05_15650 [Deminuibacter soli]|uniref:Uncharacterized protein n=1 Tax=Deminuibacter soli TaxID=2291815 RepID=A0A3E1NHM5_9BACT|nr:hypothetical protein DXN05_15650 [Deminuibacter soli]